MWGKYLKGLDKTTIPKKFVKLWAGDTDSIQLTFASVPVALSVPLGQVSDQGYRLLTTKQSVPLAFNLSQTSKASLCSLYLKRVL